MVDSSTLDGSQILNAKALIGVLRHVVENCFAGVSQDRVVKTVVPYQFQREIGKRPAPNVK